MFGYVRTVRGELRIREYEYYRASYCGLCRAMGKCTGQCSRMTLSYDFAFLAICRMALEPMPVSFEQKRCLAHPLRRRNVMKQNPILDYCASAAALLSYHKLADDLADERGTKLLRARASLPFAKRWRKKALRRGLFELDRQIAEGLSHLASVEENRPQSVDEPAAVFGDILGAIMAFGLADTEARIARQAGHYIGRWIYIADALDDAPEDAEKARYNPFLLLYGRIPTADERESIEAALKNELLEAEAAVDLLDIENEAVKSILYNVLYLGMPERIEEINNTEKKKKHHRRNGKDGQKI